MREGRWKRLKLSYTKVNEDHGWPMDFADAEETGDYVEVYHHLAELALSSHDGTFMVHRGDGRQFALRSRNLRTGIAGDGGVINQEELLINYRQGSGKGAIVPEVVAKALFVSGVDPYGFNLFFYQKVSKFGGILYRIDGTKFVGVGTRLDEDELFMRRPKAHEASALSHQDHARVP